MSLDQIRKEFKEGLSLREKSLQEFIEYLYNTAKANEDIIVLYSHELILSLISIFEVKEGAYIMLDRFIIMDLTDGNAADMMNYILSQDTFFDEENRYITETIFPCINVDEFEYESDEDRDKFLEMVKECEILV